MTWAPDYITVEDLRAYARIPDDADDEQLALAISAASRAVDRFTGRQFGNAEDVRTFDVVDGYAVVDDLARIDEIKLNGRAVTPTPLPRNASSKGRPFERLVFSNTGYQGEVEVSGLFGWAQVPDAVKQACLLQASRFKTRRDSPLGVAGSVEAGSELRLLAKVDPDVEVSLSEFRRRWGAA